MSLEERVAELERRLSALEGRDTPATEPPPAEGTFWALEGWKDRGVDGVLFTGAATLPTGEHYQWQQAHTTRGLLGDEIDPQRTAEALAALGSPVRVRLLREILAGRRTAGELTDLDGVGTSGQVYHHLRQLTATGWLHTTGRGRHEVPASRVVPLLVLFAAATP
ncbi:winged helix-turn-helix domain-containing protein [Streptomyces sp. NPDC002039]|uniref:ArsR/SmtB family transcription factor n=1 Tax=Streptomyces sp. NPDC002039 TaxID=3154660 RepID=UPI003318D8DF